MLRVHKHVTHLGPTGEVY